MFKRRGEGAFTITELLIVVIIMAVLAAIAIPKFTGQSQRSKEAALRYSLRTIRDALAKFNADYGCWPEDIEDLQDPSPPPRVYRSSTSSPWPSAWKWNGPYLAWRRNIVDSNETMDDPVSGNPLVMIRQSNGELIVRSSAPGNDSQGVPYSSY